MNLKFKIWDKTNKQFISNLVVGISNNELKHDRYEFLLHSGLKDSNCKEIYEGDIITFPHRAAINPITKEVDLSLKKFFPIGIVRNGSIGQVYHGGINYKQTHCGFYITYWPSNLDTIFDEYINRYCEIIGNIYENPKLLKS